MSEIASRLPARPSFEQLRKQAKDLLKAARAGDDSAQQRIAAIVPGVSGELTLADAQFVLAREYGFENWSALAKHVEHLNREEVRKLTAMAEELAAAYVSGDAERVKQFNWTHGTSFVHHRETEAVEPLSMDLAIRDTRQLIATHAGFTTWDTLVSSMLPAVPGRFRPRQGDDGLGLPPFCRIDDDNRMAVDGAAAAPHWDDLLDVIADLDVSKILVNGLTDRGLEALSRAGSITGLIVGGAHLTDEGMRHLAAMPQLEGLGLGGPMCRITDRGLEALRHLKRLRRFDMQWAPRVSDAGIAHLAGCDRLEHVDLMGTPTGDGALVALAGKPALRYVATGRQVTDDGLALLREFPVFRAPYGADVALGLMHFSLEHNSVLLDGAFTDRGLAQLSGLQGLIGVNLFWHTPAFTADGLSALADVPNLAFLGVDGKRCDDQAMRNIATIPRLRMLMAQGAIAADDGFEALGRASALEYLWGRDCPNLTDRGFRALTSIGTLRGLGVSCARISDETLALLPQCRSLVQLMPMDVTDAGFRHVGACERLEDLWCMYCRETTDTATEHLANLSRLTSYYAGMTRITDRSLEILARLQTLERLEFWENGGITDAGIGALATLPGLRELTIGGAPHVTQTAFARFRPDVRVTLHP
jgi:hypothetical protein